MDFIKRTLPILLGIFLLSVLVRLPQLNRPLAGHHEFCTAESLRVMQIWYDNGIEKYRFNPVMTFNHEADKRINNHANQSGKMIDAEGNYYYVSHPPFAYYFPYAIFRLLNIRPDVLPLQVFNLMLHFISGLFVYFMVCLLSFNRARALPYRSAIIAFALYVFMPVTMWFQGNVYMSDMAVHTLYIIGVYVALKMIIRQKFNSLKYIFFYVLVLGLMIYTSWLGLFFAFGVLVYSLLHVRDIPGFKTLIWSTVLVTVLTVQLIIYQYAQINGPMAYLEEMIGRYLLRGSFSDTDHGLLHFMFGYLWLLKTLLYNYVIHYIVVFALIGLFIWIAGTHKKLKIVFSENGYRFIWLSLMPVVLLHIVFLNYSTHDFTALYASLFFSVLLGILYDKMKKSGAIPLRNMRIAFVVTILLFTAQFYAMNPPMEKARYKNLGHLYGTTAATDEMIFSNDSEGSPEPQVIFYAQRNVQFAKDTTEVLTIMQQRKRQKGVFISTQFRDEGVVVTQEFHLQR